jgi:hypothetical protein
VELLACFGRQNVLDGEEENRMKPQLRITSAMLLIALLFSLAPALALPSGASAATCDWVQFIADVTVPDGSKYEPGAPSRRPGV